MLDRFDGIIRDYQESINKQDQALEMLTKEELLKLIDLLRQRLFTGASLSPGTDHNNTPETANNYHQELQQILTQMSNQSALWSTKIDEIRSKLL
ncbi:unnamed protein product [Rotaria sp. Silwood2]|nr:unnamed protein product [Rotaria sp. Silwood2]CAF2635508.1 unnamed protein product [Rotaria sp. Silwood2]CAF3892657.1 unnamed protein product [Rotaria sp. Silwood2]CAF4285832.1 unnamed protein product [Rotaria sp. Silwood2]